MDGFQRRKEEKRKGIYRVSLELFSKYGVQEVKITEIASQAHVSPVTIYNYFGSKTGLLRYVIFQFMNEQWEEYNQLLQDDISFLQKIEFIIFNKKETAKSLHPEFIQSVISQDQGIHEFLEAFYKEKAIPMLMEIIQQGRDEGYINQDVSTRTILFYINMFWETLSRQNFMSEDDRNIQLELVNVFFYGLIGKT